MHTETRAAAGLRRPNTNQELITTGHLLLLDTIGRAGYRSRQLSPLLRRLRRVCVYLIERSFDGRCTDACFR